MGTTPAPSAAAIYQPAQSAGNQASYGASALAAETPPQTYQYNPYEVNKTAALLSRAQVLANQKALQERSPEAYAGQQQAIKTISGGVAGDDQFLRDSALKSGLESAAANGTVGPGSITTPNSRGGVTAANIFGRQLLNYRDSRAQQQLGLAGSLQPDAAVSPGDAISAMEGGKQDAIANQNQFQTFLSNLRFGQVNNLNNQVQQSMGASQNNLNANANAENANRAAQLEALTKIIVAGIGAAGKAAGGGM